MTATQEVERLLEEARAARVKRDFSKSASALYQAIEISRRHAAHALEHRAWMDLGTTLRAEGDLQSAMGFFVLAGSAALRAGDRVGSARAMLRKCACLVRLSQVEQAVAFQNEMTRVYGKAVMNEAMIGTESEVGLLMTAAFDQVEHEPEKARAAFERVIALSDITEPPILVRAHVGLTLILERSRAFQEASRIYAALAELAERIGMNELRDGSLAASARCARAAANDNKDPEGKDDDSTRSAPLRRH